MEKRPMETTQHHTDDRSQAGQVPEHFFRELDIEFLVHELKDPIAVIEAGVRSLLDRQDKFGPLSPRQERVLQRVLRGALRGRGMLNHLLEIGRSEAGQVVAVPFAAGQTIYASLLDALETTDSELFARLSEQPTEPQTLALLAQSGIGIHSDPEVYGLEVIQDETKFRQIVGNLIKNALRFRRQRLDITLHRNGDWLIVDISDDGPGIKPENQALIFRRYAQADAAGALARKGHGLGLAGALVLARRLGGDLTVHSEAGKGATFRLTVPRKVEMA
jgi:two-component system OmpR family sensor kinase